MKETSILEELKSIPCGTLLRIMWLDAATVKGAKASKLPLPNYYVETRRTTVGSYIALQQGQAQKAWHIILEMDNTEGSGSTIRSIPLCLIYKIIANTKIPEETKVSIMNKKCLLIRERSLIELRDGSVKVLDRRKAR